MGKDSAIEWTDHSFNPWWGCTPVSEACEHCYAERWARRCGFDVFGKGKQRRIFGQRHWGEPLKWDEQAGKEGVKRKVFAGSMCDIFDEEGPHLERKALFGIIPLTPNLIWILCTKRPENIIWMVPSSWMEEGFPKNIWLLVTGENQLRLDQRVPHILRLPVDVLGVSIEPMLGEIELREYIRIAWQCSGCRNYFADPWQRQCPVCKVMDLWTGSHKFNPPGGQRGSALKVVIVGGETGPRPMNPDWVRKVLLDCRRAKVPFFFKHWGDWMPGGFDQIKGRPAKMIDIEGKEKAMNETCDPLVGDHLMIRVGKREAGSLFDGREYHELPAV